MMALGMKVNSVKWIMYALRNAYPPYIFLGIARDIIPIGIIQ